MKNLIIISVLLSFGLLAFVGSRSFTEQSRLSSATRETFRRLASTSAPHREGFVTSQATAVESSQTPVLPDAKTFSASTNLRSQPFHQPNRVVPQEQSPPETAAIANTTHSSLTSVASKKRVSGKFASARSKKLSLLSGSAVVPKVTNAKSLPSSNGLATAEPSAPLPVAVVLSQLDPVALGLTESQSKTIDAMTEQFIQEVGSVSQDTNNQAYFNHFTQSQTAADGRLKAAIGWEAFNSLQLAAMQAQEAGKE